MIKSSLPLHIVCVLILGGSLAAVPAIAQGIPPIAESSCDPDYYDTLRHRAWQEAQREITMNYNFIPKPDSVLQYSCFDKQLGALEQARQNMISVQGAKRGGGFLSSIGGAALGGALSGGIGNIASGGFDVSGISDVSMSAAGDFAKSQEKPL